MVEILTCGIVFILLLMIFNIYGCFFCDKLNIKSNSYAMQLLVGFFSYFIVMQVLILPIVFLRGSVGLASILWVIFNIVSIAIMLFITKDKNRLNPIYGIEKKEVPLACITLCLTACVMALAVLTRYVGWDITYYIGEMAEFLYHDSFWTHDALEGGVRAYINGKDTLNLHYAQSVYYPFWAILCKVFHVEARIMILYTARAMCVLLSSCVAFTIGMEIFQGDGISGVTARTRSRILVCIYLILSLYATASHSSAAMMIQRGYESKGYCAAVVAPALFTGLIMLAGKSADKHSAWFFTGLVAWASMPLAMSSMAIVPVAIVIFGLSQMIMDKKFFSVIKPVIICILPNVIYMAWYLVWVLKSH